MNTALAFSVAVFCGGVVFAAGRLTARVESLESWRSEVRGELLKIYSKLEEIGRLIKGAQI